MSEFADDCLKFPHTAKKDFKFFNYFAKKTSFPDLKKIKHKKEKKYYKHPSQDSSIGSISTTNLKQKQTQANSINQSKLTIKK